uniref:Uncharacterized protein MANES_04G018200 n=1 Tax=Rhizophora mucronata TaxID=61149 RepID=A0A2P2IU57_RHIMU
MGSKWRKAKLMLGLNTCLYAPPALDEDESSSHSVARFSESVSLSPRGPSTPTPSSSGLRLSKSGHKSYSKKTCAICLTAMKPGQGHAIFMAECSHSFHFHCITSNVKHGNQVCPVCRAKWKEIPFQNADPGVSSGRPRINRVGWPGNDGWMTVIRRHPPARMDANWQVSSLNGANEPPVFDDDEPLDEQCEANEKDVSAKDAGDSNSMGTIEVKTYPEFSAVSKSASHDSFNVLVHLKAPVASRKQQSSGCTSQLPQSSQDSRAPIDLITVLDVSGSMAGTKLALLKQAMGFVIQNLGPSDRLSVIAFSSAARRLFPLRCMNETGRREALQAVNSLVSNGGTNIAEGLRKGAKVIVDSKRMNPVASIILLSDGQDTYTITSPNGSRAQPDFKSLIPLSIHRNGGTGLQIPVHAFGFGADHDAASMHSISEISGGTFSFIESESVIQDAFAQCIGGLLSVVVQELRVEVECVHSSLKINSIKAGSYRSNVMANPRVGFVDVGDLYAEEERDFLVTLSIPVDETSDEMSLLRVTCYYRDPITKDMVTLEGASEVRIQRPRTIGEQVESVEVDRQRNRIRAAEAMAEARAAAENGDLGHAVLILDSCHRALSETASAQAGDGLCISLCTELKEMQERMANHQVYETSGRAYILSGLSSHSWQRATARGDFSSSTNVMQAYQTPTMVDMVTRSQTMVFGNPSNRRKLQQAFSFPARAEPR